MEDVVIVGAGIAGLAVAVALKRVGIKALVLERSDELRATGGALILFPNAWLALHALDVSHKLPSTYTSANRRSYITNLETGEIQEAASARMNGNEPNRVVNRKALLEALAEALPANSIRISSKLTMIETEPLGDNSSVAVIHIADGTVIKAKVLIGCDGVNSVVASWLGMAAPVHSGRSAIRGTSVYPKGHGLRDVHQFDGAGKRAGVVAITDKHIHWFFTSSSIPKDTNHFGGDPKVIQREVLEKYAKDFPELYLDIVKHTDLSTLTLTPLMSRLPWKVAFGKLSKGSVTVAGDAMHPMMPELGQGGCSALEDAVILGRHIGISFIQNGGFVPSQVAKALANYAEERRWRATWLITASYLSGWIQHGSTSSWVGKLFRDVIFYRFLYRRILRVMLFDCGKLPVVPVNGETEVDAAQNPIDDTFS